MPKLHRMLLRIEYDGTPFVGWQSQENGNSIQHELEVAAKKLTTQATSIQGAGRTDAGVHAKGQVAHLDLKKNWNENDLMKAIYELFCQ